MPGKRQQGKVVLKKIYHYHDDNKINFSYSQKETLKSDKQLSSHKYSSIKQVKNVGNNKTSDPQS